MRRIFVTTTYHKLEIPKGFACQYCGEVGEHICWDRLLNHIALKLSEMEFEEALQIQDAFLDENNTWWEDELGDEFWESEDEEE
jgi:hypothetical protein